MAPDYTNAFLVSAAVLCLLALMTIWALWGFLTACVIGWLTDRALVREYRRALVRRD